MVNKDVIDPKPLAKFFRSKQMFSVQSCEYEGKGMYERHEKGWYNMISPALEASG